MPSGKIMAAASPCLQLLTVPAQLGISVDVTRPEQSIIQTVALATTEKADAPLQKPHVRLVSQQSVVVEPMVWLSVLLRHTSIPTNDSQIPRTVWPQQLPEGVITTPQDNPIQMEPLPPLPDLVLPMELDPQMPQ
ncbi:uncharacterized protein LOC126183394 isoform X1 [Schistocerca cancellata]|uniref:uncharacterized protein LOC126183394 isoform X1 n=1 Tax=Schistocerca cancellata TaxID=274614 RepID=UPI002118BB8B|nr:uncharacterized protein LOC126183394 isoform X1 [Schistocerca cancellata]